MLLLFTTCQNKNNNKLKCIVSKFKIIIGKEYKKALVLDKALRHELELEVGASQEINFSSFD